MTQPTQLNPLLQLQRLDGSNKEQADLQQVAKEFEALLLRQLTSSLSASNEDDEDSLFGGDSGTGLAKQMFSEQLASAMAQAGGIGLAETLFRQFQENQSASTKPLDTSLTKSRAFSTAKIIRETAGSNSAENIKVKNNRAENTGFETPVIENTGVENKTYVPSSPATSYSSSTVALPSNSPIPSNTSATSPITSPAASPNSKVRLSASEINQYVSDMAKLSGKQQNNVSKEKATAVTAKPAKPKVQNSSNEMRIISEASAEDVEASKNYDYSSINDRYLTGVYQKSGLIDNRKAKVIPAQIVADKLPKTISSLPSPVAQTPMPTETAVKAEKTAVSKVDLDWPVRGAVRSNFGTRTDPINGKQKFHQGVDIRAARGTPIAAAGDGVVVFAGYGKKYGNNVVIQHADGRQTRYAHADTLYVQEGQVVTQGEEIAAVGSTGRSTGPHLHFEVIENGERINPIKALANDLKIVRR